MGNTSSLVTVLSSTVPTPSLVTTEPHLTSTLSFSTTKPRMLTETSTTQPAGMLPSHALTPVLTTVLHTSWRMSTTTATPRTVTTTSKSPTLTTVTFCPSNLTITTETPMLSKTSQPTSVLSQILRTTGVTNTLTMDHSPSLLVMPFSVNFSRSLLSNNPVTLVSSQCGHQPSLTKSNT